MKGDTSKKKAIIAIFIIAVLLIVAISLVTVFLRDQGETEATAIGDNNSNSQQTQDAVPENNGNSNNNQGTETQSAEPQQEQTTTATTPEQQNTTSYTGVAQANDGATTTASTTATIPAQQTTTTTTATADSQVATTTTTVAIPTQSLKLAWSSMTISGGDLLANIDANVTDVTAIKYIKLGILNKTHYVNKDGDLTYAKEGDEVRILVSFPEQLAVEPTVKVFGKEYTATYRPLSSDPSKNSYFYMVDITMTKDMPEGEIPFEIYGYVDAAGNVGETLDNSKINYEQYPRVIYDRTAPEITVKDESVGVDPYFSKVSFKFHDNYMLKEYVINGTVVPVVADDWSDANFENIKQYLVEGEQ